MKFPNNFCRSNGHLGTTMWSEDTFSDFFNDYISIRACNAAYN